MDAVKHEKRLIDANAVEAKIEKSFKKLIAHQNRPDLAAALSYVGDLIIEAPTVDAVEVVHGRWKQARYTEAPLYICSNCDKPEYKTHNYCPNCGAKMDGGVES